MSSGTKVIKKAPKKTDLLSELVEKSRKIPKSEMAKMPKNGSTAHRTPHLLDHSR